MAHSDPPAMSAELAEPKLSESSSDVTGFPLFVEEAFSNPPHESGAALSLPAVSSIKANGPAEAGPLGGTSSPEIPDKSRTIHRLPRGTPSEKPAPVKASTTTMDNDQRRDKTQYLKEAFASRRWLSPTLERVLQDSFVVADLTTNVIVEDEFTLLTNLSTHLSERFQRPESSIMISVSHSACLLLGASSDPAYMLTITALPSQVLPTKNKRNAALTQSFLADVLGVQASRGVIRFSGISKGSLASDGRTVLGDMEHAEKPIVERRTHLRRVLSRTHRRRSKQTETGEDVDAPEPSSPLLAEFTTQPPPPPQRSHEDARPKSKTERMRRLGSRKSLLGLFGRSA